MLGLGGGQYSYPYLGFNKYQIDTTSNYDNGGYGGGGACSGNDYFVMLQMELIDFTFPTCYTNTKAIY